MLGMMKTIEIVMTLFIKSTTLLGALVNIQINTWSPPVRSQKSKLIQGNILFLFLLKYKWTVSTISLNFP